MWFCHVLSLRSHVVTAVKSVVKAIRRCCFFFRHNNGENGPPLRSFLVLRSPSVWIPSSQVLGPSSQGPRSAEQRPDRPSRYESLGRIDLCHLLDHVLLEERFAEKCLRGRRVVRGSGVLFWLQCENWEMH